VNSDDNDAGDIFRALGLVGLVVAVVAAAFLLGEGGVYLRWVIAGVVMIGALVVIHEFGHFLVARAFRVGTPVFSVGIGKRLWGFRAFDTDFRLSMLPLGGYVQMAGADPFGEEAQEEILEPERDFMRKPVWQRLLIMLAGPAMNIMLPYALFTAVAMLGEPVADAVIGHVSPGTAVAEAGLEPGDRVVAVDGQPVAVWGDVADALDASFPLGTPVRRPHEVTVERGGLPSGGSTQTVSVSLPAEAFEERYDGRLDLGFSWLRLSSRVGVPDPSSPAARAGLRTGDAVVEIDGRDVSAWEDVEAALAEPGEHRLRIARIGEDRQREELEVSLSPEPGWRSTLVPGLDETGIEGTGIEPIDVYAGQISPDSAADQAGVLPGDRITAIDGTRVLAWDQVIGLVSNTAELAADGEPEVRPLELLLVRDGEALTLTFSPTWEREIVGSRAVHRPLMGISRYPDAMVDGETLRKYYGFGEALGRAHEQVTDLLSLMGDMLWNMTRREIGVTEGIGGPVAIFRIAGESAAAGLFPFVRMMGMISLSLGVVNLLPIPVLDGGQIVFYLFEAIRGRPLPIAWRERIQMVGVLLLAALFVAVMVSDVSDWLTKSPG
jgi:regulator of sigma E protease